MKSYQRWVTLSYAALAAITWLLVRQVADVVWDLARLPTPEELPLAPADFIGMLFGLVAFIVLWRNAKVNTFANEVAVELGKVTWAPRKETVLSTGVISVVVGICSLLLFVMDTVWGTLVKLMYR